MTVRLEKRVVHKQTYLFGIRIHNSKWHPIKNYGSFKAHLSRSLVIKKEYLKNKDSISRCDEGMLQKRRVNRNLHQEYLINWPAAKSTWLIGLLYSNPLLFPRPIRLLLMWLNSQSFFSKMNWILQYFKFYSKIYTIFWILFKNIYVSERRCYLLA